MGKDEIEKRRKERVRKFSPEEEREFTESIDTSQTDLRERNREGSLDCELEIRGIMSTSYLRIETG
jgi:hypothetical protein